jgi:hypothetical protein
MRGADLTRNVLIQSWKNIPRRYHETYNCIGFSLLSLFQNLASWQRP